MVGSLGAPPIVVTLVLYPLICEDDQARELSRVYLFTLAASAFVLWTVLGWRQYL